MIVIITNKNDTHADLLCEKMKARNIGFSRINTEDVLTKMEITVEFDRTTDIKPNVSINNIQNLSRIDVDKARSVWYRKPKIAELSKGIREKSTIDFVREETKAVINGIWLLMKDCFWVNNPWVVQKASNKIYQLNLAKSIGFTVPKTIITNSPIKAKRFYEQCGGDVVAKVLTYGVFEEEESVSVILTNKVLPENIKNTDFIRLCPTQLQEYIPKKTEFRITVVGKEVFACEIYSQKSERTMIDWRNYGGEIPYISAKLPPDIEEKCVKFVEELGLHFGAIDMIRTPNDRFVFLEINPSGQWYWVEEKTGLLISEALINLLVNRS